MLLSDEHAYWNNNDAAVPSEQSGLFKRTICFRKQNKDALSRIKLQRAKSNRD